MPGRFERHRRHRSMFDRYDPQGARATQDHAAANTDPEPPKRAPGKKNTKRWCRGKPGVEHQPVVALHSPYGHPCRWFETGHWVWAGAAPPRGVTLPKWPRQGREFVVTGRWWSCRHEYQCTACGKYLGPLPQCPDRPARVPA